MARVRIKNESKESSPSSTEIKRLQAILADVAPSETRSIDRNISQINKSIASYEKRVKTYSEAIDQWNKDKEELKKQKKKIIDNDRKSNRKDLAKDQLEYITRHDKVDHVEIEDNLIITTKPLYLHAPNGKQAYLGVFDIIIAKGWIYSYNKDNKKNGLDHPHGQGDLCMGKRAITNIQKCIKQKNLYFALDIYIDALESFNLKDQLAKNAGYLFREIAYESVAEAQRDLGKPGQDEDELLEMDERSKEEMKLLFEDEINDLKFQKGGMVPNPGSIHFTTDTRFIDNTQVNPQDLKQDLKIYLEKLGTIEEKKKRKRS